MTEKRRQISRLYRGNLRDAKKARAELLTEVSRVRHTGTNMTVDDLFHEWVKELGRKGRSPNTMHNYAKVYRHDVAATLARVPVSKVTTKTLTDLYGAHQRRGLKARTVYQIHATMSSMLTQACRCGWRDTNPAQWAEPPSLPNQVPVAPTLGGERRDELRDRHDSCEHGRQRAAAELVGLQPALAAVRAAWRPYAERIDNIHRDLEHNLKPAMWAANRDAMHARFGQRHAAHRRAAHAGEAVVDARICIASTHGEGSNIKERLDTLTVRAEDLSERAAGRGPLALLDGYDRQNQQHTERLLEALSTWELLIGVDSQRRHLGLEIHIQHRAADLGRDGSELGP